MNSNKETADMKNWVVVINRIEMKIYRQNSAIKPLIFVKSIENSLGREKNRALTTDKPGFDRTAVNGAVHSHSLTREKDPHEEAAAQFARQLAKELSAARKNGSYDKLILVAEPHMTGLLKKSLDKITLNCVSDSVLKYHSKTPEHELIHLLQDTASEQA
jgi:protein required for attachment to host cells